MTDSTHVHAEKETPRWQVFLSFNGKDRKIVREVAEWLKKSGIRVWFDEWQLRPGLTHTDKLEEGIQNSDSVAVFFGPGGRGPWHEEEWKAALEIAARKKDFPVIPVLLPGVPTDQAQIKIPLFLRVRFRVDFRGWPNVGHEKKRFLYGVTGKNPYDEEPIPDEKPTFGEFLHHFCDRGREDDQFYPFFDEHCRKFPNAPHFYIVPGYEEECHAMLIERLKTKWILPILEEVRLETIPAEEPVFVKWPWTGNLEDRQASLKRSLIEAFVENKRIIPKDEDIFPTFCDLPAVKSRTLLLIRHNIDLSTWDRHTPALVTWYMNELWHEWKGGEDLPQPVIFINVIYKDRERWRQRVHWGFKGKNAVAKHLRRLTECVNPPCCCLLFEELQSVLKVDARDWIDQYFGHLHEYIKQDAIKIWFGDAEHLRMVHLEKKLMEFVNKHRKELAGFR